MGNRLYVGNLAYAVTDESLQQHFGEFGDVVSAKVVMDRDSGRSKGFGFVEMGTSDQAQAAIRGLSGRLIEGRDMVVNEARAKESSVSGGGYRAGRR
jgi:RNA recognition motif-containing protein